MRKPPDGKTDVYPFSYPEHGFVIDRKEMGELMGVDLTPPESVKNAVQRLDECLWSDVPLVAIGKLKEVK
jgi:hypothetical protein